MGGDGTTDGGRLVTLHNVHITPECTDQRQRRPFLEKMEWVAMCDLHEDRQTDQALGRQRDQPFFGEKAVATMSVN